MDITSFVGKLLEQDHVDALREGVRVLAHAVMETEVSTQIRTTPRSSRDDEPAASPRSRRERPSQPGDDMLAPNVLQRLNDAFDQETKTHRDSLGMLCKSAVPERKELESFR
jgi:hypothetical protein